MVIKKDKYQRGYERMEKEQALVARAVGWDRAYTGQWITRGVDLYLVKKQFRFTIGDQLRSKETVKVSVVASNYHKQEELIIPTAQWISEGWSITSPPLLRKPSSPAFDTTENSFSPPLVISNVI